MKKFLSVFMVSSLFISFFLSISILPANAGLIVRGTGSIVGGDATEYKLIYDDDLDITWFDFTHATQVENENLWDGQMDWAAALSVNFNGDILGGWRLPITVDGPLVSGYEGDPDGDGNYSYTEGYNLANSELGHLYYTELGNLGYKGTDGIEPQPGWDVKNTGVFDNLDMSQAIYWSSTQHDLDNAWTFVMDNGAQVTNPKVLPLHAIAVHDGDVAASIPEPTTFLLLGTGLIGLAGFRKKFRS